MSNVDIKAVSEVAVVSASVGLVDGAIAAGIATAVAGPGVAVPAFAVVGGISTIVAFGAIALCQAAAAADAIMDGLM